MNLISNSKGLGAALLLLVASSCQKIDLLPVSNISPETYFTTSENAVNAVNGAYQPLTSSNLYNANLWYLIESTTDDTDARFSGNVGKRALDLFTYDASTPQIYTAWQTLYQGVARANTVLNRVPAIPMGEPLKARLLGEAKFLRGVYYFLLVRMYGGVPLVTKETTSFENLKVPKASVAEVYAQIITDFTDAEKALPARADYAAADRGRATSGAAKGMLSLVYLTRKEWQKAADKANELLTGTEYSLWDNYADAFKLENKNGKEAIFEAQFKGGGLGTGSWMASFLPPNGSGIGGQGFSDNPPTDEMLASYPAGDVRRDFSIGTSYVRNGATVASHPFVYKYRDPNSVVSDGNNNFPIMRLAEVYLIFAEAKNELAAGNPDAYAAINRIRRRAGLAPLAGLSQQAFRDAVLNERRWELAFESHRWFDLVRTGKLVSTMVSTKPNVNAKHLLFPIPQPERDINPLLEQNPGY